MRRDDLPLPEPPPIDRPGDRWVCERPADGCPRGPDGNGRCPFGDACRPRPRWHANRRRWSIGLLAACVIATGIAMTLIDPARLFRPGPLATPHAQILAGTLDDAKCASCHESASLEPRAWFGLGGDAHDGVDMTDRCLDCHHETIDRDRARLAHQLPAADLRQIRLASNALRNDSWHDRLPGPATPADQIECAVCHREHQGGGGSLLDISDRQCQTCHADRFGRFANGHPWWDDWPYGQGGEIVFDHATHSGIHFRDNAADGPPQAFDCGQCHQRQDGGRLARGPSYERGCSACHDASLRAASDAGLVLASMPSLPPETASLVGDWPERATGFWDGKLTPLMQLLLAADVEARGAIGSIPGADFARIDDRDGEQVVAAGRVAAAFRQLMRSIADEGQPAVLRRLESVGVSQQARQPLARSLPPQLVAATFDDWFAGDASFADPPPVEQARSAAPVGSASMEDSDDGLASDESFSENESPLVNDPLNENRLTDDDELLSRDDDLLAADDDPLRDSQTHEPLLSVDTPSIDGDDGNPNGFMPTRDRFAPAAMLPLGGWFRDDAAMSIGYRPAGHADRVLVALIEIARDLPHDDATRAALTSEPAVQSCLKCHRPVLASRGKWRAEAGQQVGRGFTRFSHGPHLSIRTLADCRHCHQVASPRPSRETSLTGESGHPREFEPLPLSACSSCHDRGGAPDRCTTCHRYHQAIRSPMTWAGSTPVRR